MRELAFSTGISSMTPVGRGESFDASVGTVYFWNRVVVNHPPAQIRHIWYHDGVKAAEFVMSLRYPHSRVWSHKTIGPGRWRVDITDKAGTLIAVATFPVLPGRRTP